MLNKPFFLLAAYAHLSFSCPHHLSAQDNNPYPTFVRRYAPEPRSKTAITNVRVFDGSCFTPPQTLFIDEGVITSNGQNVTTSIDATGQYIIPGLIDNHIHIGSVEGLENATSYGMTTAMNMACNNYTLCNLLKQQEGLTDFLTAGPPAVGPNSSHAEFQKLSPSQLVTDQSNAVELAQWAVGNGSDWFKITLEVNGPSYNLTNRLIAAVHAQGQQIMSHASDISAYTQAIHTVIDGIQHTPQDGNLTAVLIKQIKHNKQFVTPTMAIHAFGKSHFRQRYLSNVVHNVRAMYRAGIPLLVGTDAVGPIAPNVTLPFGETLHEELQHFVEDVGMSPAEAINAATIVAARHHRLHDRGAIKEGMRADLVLLNSNPLEDIKNTRNIAAVWAAGMKYTGTVGGKGVVGR